MFLHAIIMTIFCILEIDTVAYILFEIKSFQDKIHQALFISVLFSSRRKFTLFLSSRTEISMLAFSLFTVFFSDNSCRGFYCRHFSMFKRLFLKSICKLFSETWIHYFMWNNEANNSHVKWWLRFLTCSKRYI